MDIRTLHRWDLSEREAVALQRELAGRIDTSTPLTAWELIAGADVSFNRDDPTIYASVVVIRRSDCQVVEVQDAIGESEFPYVPGLLSFREAPTLLKAFAKLQTPPDVVVCDGQGIAHPRRLGIAAHVGLWLDRPTLGCAKSRLYGLYDPPGPEPGSQTPLYARTGDEVIGTVLRTKLRSNPVFISPGHRIDLASSVAVVQSVLRRYRLPETTRLAHEQVNTVRRRFTH
jgi:deoxyribonuclease V